MEENKKKSTIIAYFDRVIVNTLSGEIYPTNYFDMRVNFNVLKALKEYSPNRIVVFANRTVIHSGKKINNREFWSKINFVRAGISNYFRMSHKEVSVYALYSIAHEWKLDLNSNSAYFTEGIENFIPEDTLFIGPDDVTGKDFCEEIGITFINIKEFFDTYGN